MGSRAAHDDGGGPPGAGRQAGLGRARADPGRAAGPPGAGSASELRARLGRWGEDIAADHLTATGARVLARNWRCREGELDIVAIEPDGTVVFCEVKTRSSTRFGEPAEAVGPVKARRLRTLACRFLENDRPQEARDLRFDVISVVRGRGAAPRVVHLRGAF